MLRQWRIQKFSKGQKAMYQPRRTLSQMHTNELYTRFVPGKCDLVPKVLRPMGGDAAFTPLPIRIRYCA